MKKLLQISTKLAKNTNHSSVWVQLRPWMQLGQQFSTDNSNQSVNNSEKEKEKENPNQSIRESILLASLKYINQYGWNNECLAQATKDLGLPPLTHRVVRRGAPEMVQYIMDKKRSHVQSLISEYQANRPIDEESVSGGQNDEFDDKVLKTAILAHLEYLQPYRNTWAEAIAISLHPNELPYSLPTVFTLVDDLCYFSEIKSARIDWYTERALMLYLYGSTELYMLTDSSEGIVDTR